MSAASTLRRVLEALDEAAVPYMLVGSFAAMTHGFPRTTQDIDFVVDPTPESLARFEGLFQGTDVFVGPDPQQALALRDMFNVIDPSSGWKADIIICKDTDFARSEFGRRVREKLMDLDVWVASPEDTILAKLVWAKKGGSDRQVADAGGVLEVKAGVLDDAYLDHWASELGVADLLDRIRKAAPGC